MRKVIALDIGGTNTRCALINENYEIESININPTVSGDVDSFLESVANIIIETIKSFDGVEAIGIGVPGRVRPSGFIDALPNIHIENIPLSSFLSKRFNLPCFIKNDAEVAAIAEANLGPYKNKGSLYFVTISTGLGGALAINGNLVNSSYEVGHTVFEYKGSYYEFEHIASGTGLVKLCALNDLKVENARQFFDLVKAKEPLALRVYKDWIALLSSFISMIQRLFNPEVFTFTGGVFKSKDIFFSDLKKECPASRLEECGCNEKAGLLGAAVIAFRKAN